MGSQGEYISAVVSLGQQSSSSRVHQVAPLVAAEDTGRSVHRSAAARYRESPGSAPPSARPRCGLLESLYQLRSLRHLEAWFDKMVLDVAPDDTPGADRGMDEVGFLHFGRRAMLLPDDMLLDLFDVFDTTRNGKLAFADFLVLLAMAAAAQDARDTTVSSVWCKFLYQEGRAVYDALSQVARSSTRDAHSARDRTCDAAGGFSGGVAVRVRDVERFCELCGVRGSTVSRVLLEELGVAEGGSESEEASAWCQQVQDERLSWERFELTCYAIFSCWDRTCTAPRSASGLHCGGEQEGGDEQAGDEPQRCGCLHSGQCSIQ